MNEWQTMHSQRKLPKLTTTEQLIAQANVSLGIAVLTDKRLVVSSHNGERSVALTAVGSVEVAFGRSARRILGSLCIIAVAILLFVAAGHVAPFLTNQAQSIESLIRAEGAEPNAAAILSTPAQKGIAAAAGIAKIFPWLAWPLLIWGSCGWSVGFAAPPQSMYSPWSDIPAWNVRDVRGRSMNSAAKWRAGSVTRRSNSVFANGW